MKHSAKYRQIGSIIFILVFWQLSCETGWVNTKILPGPITVFISLVNLIINGSILIDMMTSLVRVIIGFLIAMFLGGIGGYFTATNKKIRDLLTPIIEVLRPIPPVAFIPLSILWFGIGNAPAYFLVAFGSFFPIYTNTFYGIISVNKVHTNAALCLGASKKQLIFEVIIPAALPFISVGLKTAMGVAWFCVIAAELVGAQSGLGYMIQLNRLTLQSDKVIAGMVMIGIIGFLMSKIMLAVQKKLVPWTNKTVI